MEIRKADSTDMPDIVSLLKVSLGEGLMPKSERYWEWKHQQNPFGQSPVLLAVNDGDIIGVRAFMRWRWLKGDRSFEAVRAVDTATHPNYQGKGIFSKLTKALLEECRKKEWHFVFNTPNKKSKPGYIKMGWQEAGKLPVNVGIVRPFNTMRSVLNLGSKQHEVTGADESVSFFLNHRGLPQLIDENRKYYSDRIITDHSVETLRWRYEQVPVAQYFAHGIEESGRLTALFFYRVKSTRIGREFRITDLFFTSATSLDNVRNLVKQKVKEHQADYVTSSSLCAKNVQKNLLSMRNVKIGPIVTVRNINATDMGPLLGFSTWSPSLGDLELF